MVEAERHAMGASFFELLEYGVDLLWIVLAFCCVAHASINWRRAIRRVKCRGELLVRYASGQPKAFAAQCLWLLLCLVALLH